MKIFTIVASFFLASFSFVTNAAIPDNIAVLSTEKSSGSVSVGGKNLYTKTFEVSVVNLSSKDIELSEFCLLAYSLENKELKLDTVDEALAKGPIKEGGSVKGIVMFASESEDFNKTNIIKISDDCK